MSFGIISLNIVPVRRESNAKSEMINQLFFGETIRVIKFLKKWSKIRSNIDNYEGWIRNLHFMKISSKENKSLSKNKVFSNSEMLVNSSENQIIIPTGSLINNLKFLNYTNNNVEEKKSTLNVALSFLNSPYLWGGKTKFGTDCSGFTQSVFKTRNIILPRDASDQVKEGVNIKNDWKSLDLAFFGDNKKNISHVGMLIGNNKIIHAYGKVRIDKLDEKGIFNEEENRITHFLQIIKRIN